MKTASQQQRRATGIKHTVTITQRKITKTWRRQQGEPNWGGRVWWRWGTGCWLEQHTHNQWGQRRAACRSLRPAPWTCIQQRGGGGWRDQRESEREIKRKDGQRSRVSQHTVISVNTRGSAPDWGGAFKTSFVPGTFWDAVNRHHGSGTLPERPLVFDEVHWPWLRRN